MRTQKQVLAQIIRAAQGLEASSISESRDAGRPKHRIGCKPV